jgi:hypothetical protein
VSNLLEFLKKVVKAPPEDDNEDWPSIVLLLEQPVLPNAEEALEMARKAWGAAGPAELVGSVGPHNFVIRVLPLTFALHAVGNRYEVDTPPLPEVQKQCWDRHKAWLSVDLPGKRTSELRLRGQLSGAYLALMYFVDIHWSENCLAAYFPAEGTMIPNVGNLIDSIHWARRNGIDLDFLKKRSAKGD